MNSLLPEDLEKLKLNLEIVINDIHDISFQKWVSVKTLPFYKLLNSRGIHRNFSGSLLETLRENKVLITKSEKAGLKYQWIVPSPLFNSLDLAEKTIELYYKKIRDTNDKKPKKGSVIIPDVGMRVYLMLNNQIFQGGIISKILTQGFLKDSPIEYQIMIYSNTDLDLKLYELSKSVEKGFYLTHLSKDRFFLSVEELLENLKSNINKLI